MALKAGRVGVAPDQVDEFGIVKSDATSGYTKQEADAKFETQTAAAAALAEKQPITLSVPLELLTGSALTVETALTGVQGEVEDLCLRDTGVVLTSSEDLDDIKTQGIYHIRGSRPTNYPSTLGTYTIVVVLTNTTATDVRQIVITNASDIAVRTRTGSPPVWSAWFKLDKTEIS